MSLKPWQTWIDSEYYQRRDIGTLQQEGEWTATDIANLKEQLWALQKQCRELAMTTVALIELLSETGGVDAHVLADRINAMAQEQK
jgi:hypothetical protein